MTEQNDGSVSISEVLAQRAQYLGAEVALRGVLVQHIETLLWWVTPGWETRDDLAQAIFLNYPDLERLCYERYVPPLEGGHFNYTLDVLVRGTLAPSLQPEFSLELQRVHALDVWSAHVGTHFRLI